VAVGAGVAAICAATTLYSGAIAVQASEARKVGSEHGLRLSLLGRLALRPRWLGSVALMTAAFALHVLALRFLPLAVVQPFQSLGLALLVVFGVRLLGERAGRRELLAIAAVAGGVAALALTGPARGGVHTGGAGLFVALVGLGGCALAPLPLRGRVSAAGGAVLVAAGCAYAWSDFVAKLLAQALQRGDPAAAAGWLCGLAAFGGLGMLWETSALQRRPAVQVAPVAFALQLVVPVALGAAVAGERWSSGAWHGVAPAIATAVVLAGALVLARSPAAAGLREAD
jgi:drug/metabolite transporter (DMT)-like permease